MPVDLSAPVSAVMHRDVLAFNAEQTVGEVLRQLRETPFPGRILYFYVTDADGRLVGVAPTRRLLLSPLEARLSSIMLAPVVSVPADAAVLDACEFFTMHRYLALPVTDERRRLVGVIDIELYTDEMANIESREAREDLFQLVGVHLTDAQARSSWQSFRGRFPWLSCNIVGGLLAALLSGVYQDVLSWDHAVLALFIPVVLALAESVSIQSVSIALDAMHGRPPTGQSILKSLRHESAVGAMLGVACASLVAAVGLIWRRDLGVALCLAGGIAGGVAAAAVIGVALPNILRLFRRNPHLAAGPIALALADMATLLIYFNLARAVLL